MIPLYAIAMLVPTAVLLLKVLSAPFPESSAKIREECG